MAQAFIFNNTNTFVSALIVGAQNQANFLLGPNTVAPVFLSSGRKALIAFANGVLFALRPIQSTAPNQVFAINPNNTTSGGGPIVYSVEAPDNIDIAGLQQSEQVQESNLIEIVSPPE